MKKIFICIPAFCFLLSMISIAQPDTTLPLYKRFPTYPPVKLLKTDKISFYTKDDLPKKSAVLLMLFNPQCDHCQHETEDIISNIEKFKGIQIVMTTTMHFDSMTAFVKKYELDKYDNIVTGQDSKYFLPTFYEIHNLPFLAFYDRKKRLIKVFEGSLPIPQILDIFSH